MTWEIAVALGWLYGWGFMLQLSLMCEVYRKTAEKPCGIDIFLALIWPISAPLASVLVLWQNWRK